MNMAAKTCPQCGNEFRCKPSHLARRVYCCKACYNAATPERMRGENNPNWKGGNKESACGECGAAVTILRHEIGRSVKFCSVKCNTVFYGRLSRTPSSPMSRYRVGSAVKPPRQKRPRPVAGANRFCPVCKLNMVPKGRKYHKGCRPKIGQWQEGACVMCGKVRRAHVTTSRPFPKMCKECCNQNKHGESNPNWKGGITPINRKIRASEEYKEWRKSVFERDGYTCVWCCQRGGTLHADHIKPFAAFPELRFEVSNGRTLCKSCHEETDTFLAKGKKIKREMAGA